MGKIKRNYVGVTLLAVCFILAFFDLKSSLITGFLSSLAFAYTNQITSYIAAIEKKHAEEKKIMIH
jgi:hypothetical protein